MKQIAAIGAVFAPRGNLTLPPIESADGKTIDGDLPRHGPATAAALSRAAPEVSCGVMSVFKPCDIRGIAGRDLTRDLAYRVGHAVGNLVAAAGSGTRPPVLIGGDVRLSTPGLKAACARGLRDAGCDSWDLGMVPTPVLYFARRHLGVGPAVVVTASHNPARYNGFKIHVTHGVVTPGELREIERRAAAPGSRRCATVRGRNRRVAIDGDYLDWLSRLGFDGGGLRVVVDAANGTLGILGPKALRAAGFRVHRLFCEPDGRFPNHDPNPSTASNLRELGRRVRRVAADLGVAFDADGDRVTFVDECGMPAPTDAVVAFLADALVREARATGERTPLVVHDIKCASVVPRAVRAAGGRPIEERSGHAFQRARMVRENALFGGEASGHFFYRTLGGNDDGLYTALLVASRVAARGDALSRLLAAFPVPPITPDIRIPCERAEIESLLRTVADREDENRVSRIDGVRVRYRDGWALARPSVTEPILTLRFEARRAADLPRLARRFLDGFPRILGETLRRMNETS